MNKDGKHKILIIRFSSLGDNILTIPVLQSFLNEYKNVELFVLTKKSNAKVYSLLNRTKVIEADFENKHKGLIGLFKLYKQIINNYNIDIIFDLHNVLRTKILGFLFKFKNIKFYSIDKNRNNKNYFLKYKNSIKLKSILEIYYDVFKNNGFIFKIDLNIDYATKIPVNNKILEILNNKNIIAIAPFAAYKTKIYPLNELKKIIDILLNNYNFKILLLGKGEEEEKILNDWYLENNNIILTHNFNLIEQIKILNHCKIALVMDSANLHLSGLASVKKIISIWGSTSPYAGFNVWPNTINVETNLECKPCSIYGNKKCKFEQIYCMNNIHYTIILNNILNNIDID